MTTPTRVDTTTNPIAASRPSWLNRLRKPNPDQLVRVTFTGTPTAVTAIARALASVVEVTAMRHQPTTDTSIRLDATCIARPSTKGNR